MMILCICVFVGWSVGCVNVDMRLIAMCVVVHMDVSSQDIPNDIDAEIHKHYSDTEFKYGSDRLI
jgi:hypothetical protein